MKFVVLMAEVDHFAKWDTADEVLRARVVADFQAFDAAVRERGAIVAGEALDHPSTARTIQPDAAATSRSSVEGPYAETVEQLGGFYLIDVPDLDTALEVTALLPREYLIEVRPVLEVEF